MKQTDRLLALIESEIRKTSFGRQPASLYQPIRYIMSLGGKRMRPMLTCLGYAAFKRDVARVIPFAVATEAFHNFTLMHDDIMDNAPLRRGKATVHEKWNVNTAILSGDVMLVRVYDLFLQLEGRQLKQVLQMFNICAAEVCEGQQWDMEFETRKTVSEKEYLNMIRLKTAVLLGFSLELGAVLAGASAKDRALLKSFGVNLGIGFQLMDDLMDVYADQKKFGKQVGGDIIANKKTFLLINALALARGADKTALLKWLRATRFKPAEKVKAVTALYNKLGIPQKVERKIAAYFKKAFADLERVSSKADKSALRALAQSLAIRQR
jgi:geranylgeranyl diphosphate synthase type II